MLTDHFRNITIVGAQKSGLAAAVLLKSRRASVCLTEMKAISQCAGDLVERFRALDIPLEFGGHSREVITESDLIVLSPGVPYQTEVVRWAREAGLPVLTEIELAFQFCSRPVIGITGSNGKTTVTTLVHEVLTRAGFRAALCGNIGTPFAEVVQRDEEWDYYVVELSSFQTEAFLNPSTRPEVIKGFHPQIAAVLNFSQNHLDRHRDLEDYLQAKKRIFLNQCLDDYAVLNARDPYAPDFARGLKAKIKYFNPEGSRVNPNHAAVESITACLGVPAKLSLEVCRQFQGVRHRMQRVAVLGGVTFINDSKSTTTEATRWALTRLDCPIHLICGGRDKQLDFTTLRSEVQSKVKAIYAIGEAAGKVEHSFGDVVTVVKCQDLATAVKQAYQQARDQDVVLLSPMCASFDMFRNFEHRGDCFCQIVEQLQNLPGSLLV